MSQRQACRASAAEQPYKPLGRRGYPSHDAPHPPTWFPMLRLLRPVVILMLAAVVPMCLPAQAIPSPKTLHAALGGRWSGTLRYRDYQDSTRFVSLPTVVEGTAA